MSGLGLLPRRALHRCQLPGDGGMPLLDDNGAPVWLPDGMVVRCEVCGRSWVLRFAGWRRARWWTLRRLRHA